MPESHTILLVDDDPDIVRAADMRLRSAGYKTLTAYDGQDGVIAAVEGRPDLIVLDVRMPRMDGFAALAAFKERLDTRDIPVIMLSASIHDQQAALDAGARHFLRKPYRGEMLVQAVDALIRENQCLACAVGANDPHRSEL